MNKIVSQIILLVIVFARFDNIAAQDSSSTYTAPVFIHPALLYDIPQSFGFTCGADYSFGTKIKITKRGNETVKTALTSYLFSADLGFYRYPFNHTGFILKSAVGMRYSGEGKFISELLFEAGLLRTFYDGKVYEVSDSNTIKEKKLFGRFYATTGVAGIFGWDLEKDNRKIPVFIFLKPSLWLQFPYNSFYEIHFSLEAGVNYHLRQIHSKNHRSIKYKILNS
jgi:hypothetical protein